ncbi:M16 family metallopeptidase [Christiangramia aestuarii]|uniref:Insulinase family protein n=1 Tax=Christiangramia aestuarii TaxID=1028746 RepID=A0A7K1LNJ2_9FLAO|nr:pitrilysin family protein [Christiangramia aestuarii]MUP42375.1 insulinase family protein [Christiangramia aestuarii]
MKKYLFTINAILFLAFSSIAQIDRSKQPEPGPAPKINLEEPETFTLDNGLKVMVVENHKLPRVSMILYLDNPPVQEGEKAGVSSLTGGLLGTGTKNTSKDKYNEEIDFLGASVSFNSNIVRANTLSKFFPRILELVAEGALQPNFTQEEFEKLKEREIENLESNEKDVAFNARRLRQALNYGKDHPYGEFTTVESLKNVSLEDVKQFYNTYFVPEEAYLAIIGDVDIKEVKKLVKKNFSSWKKKALPESSIPEVNPVETTEISFLNMPNAVQSQIAVVNPVKLTKNNPDYFPALIANQILGGGSDGRLFLNLREDKGYTYGSYSSLGDDKYVSSFVATAEVRNEVTDSAVVAFLDEIHRIRKEKVSQEELENAKNKYVGNFVLSLESPSTIAFNALNIETEDLDEDFYEEYLENINEVTAEDVQRVAKKYFKIDNARIVVAGKGSEVLKGLENLKYNGKSIPVKYYNKKAEQVEKPEEKKVDASVTADKVFDKYLKAIGGREAVESVNSVLMNASTEIQGMKLDLESKQTTDGKSYQAISMNGNVMNKQVFNGESGYVMAQGQKMPYNEEQIATAKVDANPFPELSVNDAKVTGIEQVNGEDAYVVKLDENNTAYYSVDSGMKVKSVKTVSQAGQTMSIPSLYSDYREVSGVKFPFMIAQSMGPQSFEFEVSEIQVNEGVSEEDFATE